MNQSVYKKDLRPSKQFEAVILLSQVLEVFLLYWRISSSPVKNNNFHVRYFRLFSFLFLYQESEDVFLFISGIGGSFSFYIRNRRTFFFLYQESEDVFLLSQVDAAFYTIYWKLLVLLLHGVEVCFPYFRIGGCYIYHTVTLDTTGQGNGTVGIVQTGQLA